MKHRPGWLSESQAHQYNLPHGFARGRRMPDNKNVLYLIIGVLLVAVGVLSYNLYQAKKQPEGFQINVGPDGLKIQGK
jgi:hypothetical protein